MFVPLQSRYTGFTRPINSKLPISNTLRLRTYNICNNKKIVIANVEAIIVAALSVLPIYRDFASLSALNYYTVITIVLRQQLALVRIIIRSITTSASLCPQSLRPFEQLLLYSCTYSRCPRCPSRYSRQYSYRYSTYSQRLQKPFLNKGNSIELIYAELLKLLVLLAQGVSNTNQHFVIFYGAYKDIPNGETLVASFYRSKPSIYGVLFRIDKTISYSVTNTCFELFVSEILEFLSICLLQVTSLVIQFI